LGTISYVSHLVKENERRCVCMITDWSRSACLSGSECERRHQKKILLANRMLTEPVPMAFMELVDENVMFPLFAS
jgi:hypothetical protein